MFSLVLCGFSPSTPVSSYSSGSKLTLGDPAMSWWLIQGVPLLLSRGIWGRVLAPPTLLKENVVVDGRMGNATSMCEKCANHTNHRQHVDQHLWRKATGKLIHPPTRFMLNKYKNKYLNLNWHWFIDWFTEVSPVMSLWLFQGLSLAQRQLG